MRFDDEFWGEEERCARCYKLPKGYRAFKLCPSCGRPLCPKHENDCCRGTS